MARRTLTNLSDFENIDKEKKRFSEQVLNGLIYFGRCYLEEAKNRLSKKGSETEDPEKVGY